MLAYKYLASKSLLFQVLLINLILGFGLPANSQSVHSISFKPQYFQIKESFNYGLVHDGLNLGVEYTLTKRTENIMFSYSPEFSFGINYAQGVGMAWYLQPVDIFYGWKIGKHNLFIGPYFSMNYQWQLYPELQSGHLYWYSSFELGPQLMLDVFIGQTKLNIMFSNVFLGWVSRPEPQPTNEVYFYSLAASDWIGNAHQDLTFGFNNLFNNTILKIELDSDRKVKWGYEFNYFGYFEDPKVQYMSHAITMKWKLGK
jgi:hypothetical protein